MTKSTFFDLLEQRSAKVNSLLCIGLDPHPQEIQKQATSIQQAESPWKLAFEFCKTIIDATHPYAACYKPNSAFFEALGHEGTEALRRVIEEIAKHNIPVLLDGKRGDIGSTAAAYAQACYDYWNADAVTLSPLMGLDSITPFISSIYAHKGAFLLCKTSNPGSEDFLALSLASGETFYERIATLVGHDWKENGHSNLGLVVGATDAVALRKARQAAGDGTWILAPGVGAQGGDLVEALKAGLDSKGSCMLVPVSRGISRAEDPGKAAQELQIAIQKAMKECLAAKQESESSGMLPYQEDFIKFSLSEGVLKFGSFTLKSGRISPYFFNAGLFCTGKALHKLGEAYAAAIVGSKTLYNAEEKKVSFDVIFGPAYKGISLGALVSSALYARYGIDVGFSYNRKEAKDHGEGGKLVGAAMENKNVLIVDDVITAGTAIRESHTMLTEIKANIAGVVIALDRAEKRSLDDPLSAVQAVARDLNVAVVSIVSLPQLQVFLTKTPGYGPEVLQSVSEYRTQYGVSS